MFYIDYIDGRRVVKSDLLDITHFFTTRDCCIFSKEEDMSYNRRIIEGYVGTKMATNQPVHGVHIEKIIEGRYFYEATDGLLIEKGGAAYMNFGDCTPIIFYCRGVAIIAHAGWRGTVQGMAKKCVKILVENYGFNPKDIKAVIGPAICFNCYEVGTDVYEGLYRTIKNPLGYFKEENGRLFVDLKGINRQQLMEAGVDMVDVCPFCTACGKKLFYSYRYENHTGYRHSAVVWL